MYTAIPPVTLVVEISRLGPLTRQAAPNHGIE